MNILLCNGDRIEGTEIILIEGKSIDMVTTEINITPIEMLMRFCVEQTAKGNHFFLQYSGHINTIDIRGYAGEWAMLKEVVQGYSCRVDQIDLEKAERWIQDFKNKLSQE